MEMPACFLCMEESWNRAVHLQLAREKHISLLLTAFIVSWSEEFTQEMDAVNMPYEFYIYNNDDHNISNNYREAMQRTVAFFNQYVKGN